MSLGVALNYIFRSLFSRLKAHQEIEVCAKGQLTLQTKRSNDKRQTAPCTDIQIEIQIQTTRTKRSNDKDKLSLYQNTDCPYQETKQQIQALAQKHKYRMPQPKNKIRYFQLQN